MLNCPLPMYIQVLQALAVPTIAVFGVLIAWRQMEIARVKLQHDLYDRRYAIFQAVRRLLDDITHQKTISDEIRRSFTIGISDAEFLFDNSITSYLKQMKDHVFLDQSINAVMEFNILPPSELASASYSANEHRTWLLNQIDGLSEKFRPWLKLDASSRAPLRSPW